MFLGSHRRPALLAAGAVALLGAAAYWWSQSGTSAVAPAGPAAVPVTVSSVTRADVPHLTSAIGTAQALESVVIRPQLDGVLTSLRFVEGQQVRRGDLLATLDERAPAAALQGAAANLLGREAELASARLDLQRYTDAVDRGAISRQTLDQQQALVRQLEAAVASARADLAAARVTLAHTRILAPITGQTGIRRVDVGNFVRTSDPDGLVTVARLKPIAVMFALPQDDLPRVQGLAGRKSAGVSAFARVGGELLGEGRVVTVDNAVDATTGTIRLKAEFPNPDGMLWPGQFVTVQLNTGLSAGALTIPAGAVQRGRDEHYVFRVRDNVADMVPVTLGYETDVVAVVTSGLGDGDVVVTDGQSRLKPGDRVQIVGTP